MTINSDK